MSEEKGRSFYELEIYKRYEQLSDVLRDIVDLWNSRYQNLIGDQMLRAVDSIGANIAEAMGRGHFKECLHHLYYSRGSLSETQHWIRRAIRRRLLNESQTNSLRENTMILSKQLNAFIRSQKPAYSSISRKMLLDRITEPAAKYSTNGKRKPGKSHQPKAISQ